ncbi:MAG: hypothetical protein E6R13_00320 [Spirochaetes bacterium]|nr:MAG: hypothetical protein E6R13_00320 [Spirochaetota bacterium]
MSNVSISREKLQKLLDNFYEVCSLCDEMDIYEFEEGDEAMQEMKEWAEETFGREIDKENYE